MPLRVRVPTLLPASACTFLLSLSLFSPPADAAPPPRSELPSNALRVVDYDIRVRLDPAERLLKGEETLTWTNTTSRPTDQIHLHLYLNAFRNNLSTFLRESAGRLRGHEMEEGEWGWIDLTSVRLANGEALTDRIHFAHPDDDNAQDRTVAVLPLPREIPPGGSVVLQLEFTARLPNAFARTGFKGSFFLVAQWYPKPGVFLGDEGWNCHQFHASTEFFADFGRYDVSITVPQDYVVGASGREAAPAVENADGTTTRRFFAEDVHDFAWAADPRFLRRVRSFSAAAGRDPDLERLEASILGYPASDLTLSDVEVVLLLQPEHVSQEERMFRAAFAGLRVFGTWFGRYPYPTLTIVDPRQGAAGAGGMEYPTLITAGTSWLAPRSRLSPESVTVHEFAHQYWYGMSASNEFEESWLDEGMATWSTGKLLDQVYGARTEYGLWAGVPLPLTPLATLPEEPERDRRGARPDPLALHFPTAPWALGKDSNLSEWLLLQRLGLPDFSLLRGVRDVPYLGAVRGLRVPSIEGWRSNYLSGPKLDSLVRRGWEYMDAESYRLNSYRRPALALATLEKVIGGSAMHRVMRKYHERSRFRHPTTADFVRTVEEVSARDLSWLLQPLLFGNDVLDYAVAEVKSSPAPTPKGVFGEGSSRILRGKGEARPGQPFPEPGGDVATRPAADAEPYQNEVLVRRLGEVRVPVVVEFEMEDGSRKREPWDGDYRWRRFTFTGPARVARATVDPDGIYPIDIDWANNSRAAAADHRATCRWGIRLILWLQNILAFYGGLA